MGTGRDVHKKVKNNKLKEDAVVRAFEGMIRTLVNMVHVLGPPMPTS